MAEKESYQRERIGKAVKAFKRKHKKDPKAIYVGDGVWDEITADPSFKNKDQMESGFKTATYEGIQCFVDNELEKDEIVCLDDFKR